MNAAACPLIAALEHARAGRPVVVLFGVIDGRCACGRSECSSPGKHPVTPHGLRDATADVAEIERLFGAHPSANYGVLTGAASAWFVIDVDPPQGEDSLAALQAEIGPLPETREHRTPRGGRHLVFACDDPTIGNSTGKLGPNLDTRANGGYVVGPGSVGVNGSAYEVVRNGPPAPLPEALRERLVRPPTPPRMATGPRPSTPSGTSPYGRAALDDEAAKVAAAAVGSRNAVLNTASFVIGQLVGGGEIDQTEAEAALSEAARSVGLGEVETERTLRSGLGAGLRDPRRAPDRDPQRNGHADDADQAVGAPGAPNAEGVRRDDALPEIVVGFDDGEALDKAEIVLHSRDGGRPIYVRSGRLVRVLRAAEHGSERVRKLVEDEAPVIDGAPVPWLRERLSSVAEWKRLKKSRAGPVLVRVDPPERYAAMLAARGEWSRFRPLRGILEAPCLRPDGSILDRPGYDEATGLLFVPGGAFPAIPAAPTLDGARAALKVLLLPIAEFPFVAESDKSAALATILLHVGRYSVTGPAPMTFYRSTVRGSGKTLLQKITGAMATGRIPPLRFNVRDTAEVRKALYALALAGVRYVAVDNVSPGDAFGNEVWAAALTTGVIDDRILGKSESKAASLLGITFTGSGNNTSFRSDMGRRVIPCDIDPACERPEERSFKIGNLEHHVVAEWKTYHRAALVVLRAHAVAGWPQHGRAALGSYETWDARIRSALIWCGHADPCEGRDRVHDESDQDVESLRAAMQEWARVIVGAEVTLAEVVEAAGKDAALRGALEAFADSSPKKPLTAGTLGYAMRSARGRVVGRFRFVSAGESGGARKWKLEEVPTARGDEAIGAMVPTVHQRDSDD